MDVAGEHVATLLCHQGFQFGEIELAVVHAPAFLDVLEAKEEMIEPIPEGEDEFSRPVKVFVLESDYDRAYELFFGDSEDEDEQEYVEDAWNDWMNDDGYNQYYYPCTAGFSSRPTIEN